MYRLIAKESCGTKLPLLYGLQWLSLLEIRFAIVIAAQLLLKKTWRVRLSICRQMDWHDAIIIIVVVVSL